MDLSDPTRAVTPTLDGPVLAVLASAGRPLTVGQVAEQAVRGSEIGIRRSLARLVEQGIVRATLMGRNQVHELNREHVAAEAAVLLADLRTRLWGRFRSEFDSWEVRPLYAAVFGSAARGDGNVASDIDLFLIHPPFPGDPRLSRSDTTALERVVDVLGAVVVATDAADGASRWEEQLDRLRGCVEQWTGNPLQIVSLSFVEWRHPPEAHRALLRAIEDEGIELYKINAMRFLPAGAPADG